MAHVHQRFSDDQVKNLLQRYIKKEIERKYIQEILGIKKRRFFALLKQYRRNPKKFSIEYVRKVQTRSIDPQIEKNIIKELTTDKKTISYLSLLCCLSSGTLLIISEKYLLMKEHRNHVWTFKMGRNQT